MSRLKKKRLLLTVSTGQHMILGAHTPHGWLIFKAHFMSEEKSQVRTVPSKFRQLHRSQQSDAVLSH